MKSMVAGKRVAVIGRAASIHGSGHGPEIDSADVVVRVNWVLPLDPEHAPDIGTRTDLIYHCWRNCNAAKSAATSRKVRTHRIDGPLRRDLAIQAGKDPAVYRPNTGTVAIFDVLKHGAQHVSVYGMDLFRSGHAKGQPLFVPDPRRKRSSWHHDPTVDVQLIADLVKQGQVSVSPELTKVLG